VAQYIAAALKPGAKIYDAQSGVMAWSGQFDWKSPLTAAQK
jgi:hypothetical protein